MTLFWSILLSLTFTEQLHRFSVPKLNVMITMNSGQTPIYNALENIVTRQKSNNTTLFFQWNVHSATGNSSNQCKSDSTVTYLTTTFWIQNCILQTRSLFQFNKPRKNIHFHFSSLYTNMTAPIFLLNFLSTFHILTNGI